MMNDADNEKDRSVGGAVEMENAPRGGN